MPVPSLISDLSTSAALNSPADSESPATTDDYFRAHASFIAALRSVLGGGTDPNIAFTRQSSATDTTAGAVLSVGAFGQGVIGFPPNAGTFDALKPSGLYRAVSGTDTGTFPSGVTQGTLAVIPFGTTTQRQVLYVTNGGANAVEIYTRQLYTVGSLVVGPWSIDWTDSNLVKQTSAFDTTAGSMMAVGAFGLGMQGPITVNSIGMNLAIYGGFGSASSSTTNIPYSAAWNYVVIPASTGTTHCTQIAVNPANGDIQTRSYTGSWSSWVGLGSFGVGQSWQAVTRVSGTTYTNTSGKPINWVFLQDAGAACTVSIGGVSVFSGTTGASDTAQHSYVIPVGATYVFTCTNAKNHVEMR